jgi:hypothetical protein
LLAGLAAAVLDGFAADVARSSAPIASVRGELVAEALVLDHCRRLIPAGERQASYRLVASVSRWIGSAAADRDSRLQRRARRSESRFAYGGIDPSTPPAEKTKALNLMIALNKANLTVKSLQRRVLEQLAADGLLAGSVTGTPD